MQTNADPEEIARFSSLADRWWDPEGDFRPLHQINPLRLEWIASLVPLQGCAALDVGCGGGILCEALAAKGARVKGIDLSEKALGAARHHLAPTGLEIDYEMISPEALAVRAAGRYDLITCMEMLEHVPDPASAITACAALARPGGNVFFSTINRNPKSYLFAVVGAEYLLKLLPRGTHDYTRFIKPSELARHCRDAGLEVRQVLGMSYNPLMQRYSLGSDTSVNYLIHAVRRTD